MDHTSPHGGTVSDHINGPRWLGCIDQLVGGAIEKIAALLVAAEVVILFAGVVSRYLLQKPLTWSDELASTLFLWLAMFGAVIAVRQNSHMRMTAHSAWS